MSLFNYLFNRLWLRRMKKAQVQHEREVEKATQLWLERQNSRWT